MLGHRVVCIVGSTRFMGEMARIAERETLAGNIILMPHVIKSRAMHSRLTDEARDMLDHLRHSEVRLSDEVLVVNIGGYIGQSTIKHIALAKSINKPIRFEEPRDQLPDKACLLCNGTGERRVILNGIRGKAVEECPRCKGTRVEPER